MKRFLTVLTCLSMLAALIAGCGNSQTTEPEKISGFDVSLERQYDYAGEFNEGFAKVGKLNAEGNMKYFFINTKGEVISAEYDYADDFSDGMAVVANRKNFDEYSQGLVYGYIDTAGKEAIPLQFDAPGSEDRCYSFYNGMAVVQRMLSEDGYLISTYLIDKQGNKVTGTELFEPGYGGYGMEDPRILYLEATYSSYDKYIGWSGIQRARVNNEFPVYAYSKETGTTLQLDEKLQTVSEIEGKLINGWDDISLVDYDFGVSWDKKALIKADGSVLKENISNAYKTADGIICITTGDGMEHLYSTDGNIVEENLYSYKYWTGGHFLERAEDEFTVTDKDFNVLWTVKGKDLYQSSSYGYYSGDKFVQVYEPLFRLGVERDDKWGNKTTVYNLVNPENGQVVIPYMEQTNINHLSDEFYYITRLGANSSGNPPALFNIKTNSSFTLDGIYNVNLQRSDSSGTVVTYSTEPEFDSERITAYLSSDRDGHPVFDRIDTAGEGNTTDDTYVMIKNDISSIWGIDGERVPVVLKKGDDTLGEFTASSLVYKNIRKNGRTVNWDYYKTTDISIVNLDGETLTETYEDMGRLSEGYISFCAGGKWGYLISK